MKKEIKTDENSLSETFMKCADFHGHICPGLAIGFRAARILMERLGVRRAPDEELVAIVETDACSADAMQVLTGCTFGKGNFILKSYGKHAFSLIDRNRGKAVRVCLLPGGLQLNPKHTALYGKVRNNLATPEEIGQYKSLQQERVRRILEIAPESLSKIEEISPAIPPEARVVDSGICDLCGELTKIDLLQEVRGQKVCIPCAQKQT